VKLHRCDILHGYPAKKIRDFLGHGCDGAFSHRDYCEVETFFVVADDYFGCDAKAVTAELLERGWIIEGKGRDLKECTEDQNTPGKRRSEWHIERAKQSGRNLPFREMLSYGATEVERLLKARKDVAVECDLAAVRIGRPTGAVEMAHFGNE